MKKIYYLLAILAVILSLSFLVGIYYYESHEQTSLQPGSDNVFITRKVIYEGIVIPEEQSFWQETINDVIFTGTVKLSQMIYNKNKTIAVYEGTLTVME